MASSEAPPPLLSSPSPDLASALHSLLSIPSNSSFLHDFPLSSDLQRLLSLLSSSSSSSSSTTTTGHARFRSSRNSSSTSFASPSVGSKRAFLALSHDSADFSAVNSFTGAGALDIDLNDYPNSAKDDSRTRLTPYVDPRDPVRSIIAPDSHGFSFLHRDSRSASPVAKSARIDHDSKSSNASSLSAASNVSFDLNADAPSMECNSDFSFPASISQDSFAAFHESRAPSNVRYSSSISTSKPEEKETSRTFPSQGNLVPEEEFTPFRKDDCNGGARLATDLDLSLSGGGELCTVNDEGSFTPKLGASQKTLIFGYNCAATTAIRSEGEGNNSKEFEAKKDLLKDVEKAWNCEDSNAQTFSHMSCTTMDTVKTAPEASAAPWLSQSKVSRSDTKSKCHCRSRKLKKKWSMRVPAISDKIAEIPLDDHSWRKYGQKPIKGSPYPRGYYKCSGVKGCPAKKHVERALDDPTMLIVTYEGEHVHPQSSLS